MTTNGGSSIKDTVNRIDRRQVIIDKRSKAIFYNVEDVILEVDNYKPVKYTKSFKHVNLSQKYKQMEIKDKEEVNFNINSEEDFPSL